jgi:putative transposase
VKSVRTAKLKLTLTPEQHAALRATQRAYQDALNFVSRYAFEHGKMSNQKRLQRETYANIRAIFGLPAQMACNVPRQVGASYRGLWTKAKMNKAARHAGHTKKYYRGLDHAPRFRSVTLTYNYRRDYNFKSAGCLSILTLSGRVVVPYEGFAPYVEAIQADAHCGAAKLWYDERTMCFYLLVPLEVDIADTTPEHHTEIVGVDLGQRYLAVTTTPTDKIRFYAGREARHTADHYARLRKRLQRKGTRRAKRRARALGQRERRLMLDRNHVIAKQIVSMHPSALIGVEDLRDMRTRTRRKRGQKASCKQRRANRHAARWSFAQLQEILAYKTQTAGGKVIQVDAQYTSQMCPRCGYTSRKNRPQGGLLFRCCACGLTLHADLIGARNIALRTLLIWQDWMSAGELSGRPDVADEEAKAARLSRYAELRWSPAASPRL